MTSKNQSKIDHETDHYKTLGVDVGATNAQIKKAYHKLAKEIHPDRKPNDPKATAEFQKIGEAYEVLIDENKRKEYDLKHSHQAGDHTGNIPTPAVSRPSAHTSYNPTSSSSNASQKKRNCERYPSWDADTEDESHYDDGEWENKTYAGSHTEFHQNFYSTRETEYNSRQCWSEDCHSRSQSSKTEYYKCGHSKPQTPRQRRAQSESDFHQQSPSSREREYDLRQRWSEVHSQRSQTPGSKDSTGGCFESKPSQQRRAESEPDIYQYHSTRERESDRQPSCLNSKPKDSHHSSSKPSSSNSRRPKQDDSSRRTQPSQNFYEYGTYQQNATWTSSTKSIDERFSELTNHLFELQGKLAKIDVLNTPTLRLQLCSAYGAHYTEYFDKYHKHLTSNYLPFKDSSFHEREQARNIILEELKEVVESIHCIEKHKAQLWEEIFWDEKERHDRDIYNEWRKRVRRIAKVEKWDREVYRQRVGVEEQRRVLVKRDLRMEREEKERREVEMVRRNIENMERDALGGGYAYGSHGPRGYGQQGY